ncbi:MAG: gamma carbonic anhydrase family protein [Rhodomicrobium sp.]|jgi:carbonic anhydrase/acetyltransferase-like protein (isoleucine patch superfamily)
MHNILALDGVSPHLPPIGAYWIAPNAIIVGKVALGRDVSVWYGSVLRGDNELIEIGEGTNIQEHCVLHTDKGVPFKVGRGCTIGHKATLHGCIVGDNCLIGIGATILNGAAIGDNCIVGAHALITEGKSIPPGSVVMGSPAKIVRTLGPEEIEGLRASAAHYVQNARRFRTQLSEAGGGFADVAPID